MTNPFAGLGDRARILFTDNRHIGILVLAALVLFGGGIAVGRYTLPAKIVITETVKEVEKQVVVEKVKTEVQVQIVKVHDKQQAEKIHRVTVEGIDPPGCKSKTVTEDINVDTVVHDNTNTHETEVRYVDRVVEKQVEKLVEKTKTVINQPDWMVQAGAGVAVPALLGHESPGVPGLRGAVIDVGLSRRVVGPFWLGLSGNTQGVVSLQLTGTF
jgi:hypothetical protein